MKSKVSWKELLEDKFDDDELIANTLSNEEYNRPFDDGFGGPEGKPFTAWSKEWVYFPVCYDGAEWVERVPRNPCDVPTEHVGGY